MKLISWSYRQLRFAILILVMVPISLYGIYHRVQLGVRFTTVQTIAFAQPPSMSPFIAAFITHGRVANLERSLRSFLSSIHHDKFPVFVSLDDAKAEQSVTELVRRLEGEFRLPPESVPIVVKPGEVYPFYERAGRIAELSVDRHVFFALREALKSSAEFVVFIEDDLILSPDFLQLMLSGAPMLRKDKSLYCVSAWNENAYDGEASDPSRLLRTNVFPGLGWMMRRDVVKELVDKWPGQYSTWDWWFRRPDVSLGRECVVPEIPRSHHIGANGVHVSENKDYDDMISATVSASEHTFSFDSVWLELYDESLRKLIGAAKINKPENFSSVKNVKNSIFLIPVSSGNDRLLQHHFRYFSMYRISHRGLVIKRKPENNSLFIFVDTRRGAEWLAPELRDPLTPGLQVVTSNVGENCEATCQRKHLVCSFVDFGLLQNCDLCPSGKDKCVVRDTVHSHTGLLIEHDAKTCSLSTFGATNCQESFPGQSRLCPCLPAFDLRE